jgi:hypothetical protein
VARRRHLLAALAGANPVSDIIDRARRLLQQGQAGSGGASVPATPPQKAPEQRRNTSQQDQTGEPRRDMLVEARALLDRPARSPTLPKPLPAIEAPPPSRRAAPANAIRVPITCGKFGRAFVALAEIHGKNLVLTRNEALQSHGYDGAAVAASPRTAVDLGSYRIAAAPEWCCPYCRTRVNTHPLIMGELVWQCFYDAQKGALHCVGSDPQGGTYCACGQYEVRSFTAATAFDVRGERAAPPPRTNRPEPPRAATMRSGSPPAAAESGHPELAPPAPAFPQLPWKR